MISPTLRAIWLMALGVPLLVVVGLFAPSFWVVAGGWIAAIATLCFIDAAIGARLSALSAVTHSPPLLYVGASDPAELVMTFEKGPTPKRVEAVLETSDLISPPDPARLAGFLDRKRSHSFRLKAVRRGAGRLTWLWIRWVGPLGLVQKRRRISLDREVPIIPDIRWVKSEATRLYARDADFGIKLQFDRGDGSEFDALRDFAAGMDRRSIDWKHSARHRSLFAKEFRTERNHNIVFAFDTGRLMGEPLGSVAKLDRAINAALLLSFVSLRAGDRTALFGFDARPNVGMSRAPLENHFSH
ncbi:MAG: DUF58 domain-containing protein, partial [Pseudomonadota bacterium]